MSSNLELMAGINQYTDRDWQTTDEGTIRFALIGLGWWTVDVALPAIKASDFCETTVLVSGSKEKAEEVADQYDGRGITYDEFHDANAAGDYDAIYIGTPNAFHFEYVETAAKLDKAVLCEKPLEASVERAEALVETAEAADIPLMTAYRMQTNPAVRRAKEFVQGGLIGNPVQAYSNNAQPLLEMIPDHDQWRLSSDLSGYGTSVMDLGIYSINTTRFILDRDPVSATAWMRSPSEEFDDVPDEFVSYVLIFEDDIPLQCTASQNAQDDSQLKIIGTDGQIELSPAFHGEVTLQISKGDFRMEIEDTSMGSIEEMREEFDYFANCVLTGGEIDPDGYHGLCDIRTIEAIHKAATDNESSQISSKFDDSISTR